MNARIVAAALACTAFYASGCATVRMGEVAHNAEAEVAAQATASQQQLRAEATALIALCESRGWSDGADAATTARRTLSLLLHGRGEAAEDARPNAAQTYLAEHEGEALAVALQSDIGTLADGVAAVNAAAARVVADADLNSDTIDEDMREVERAIQRARGAQSMFAEAIAEAGPALSDADRSALNDALDLVSSEIALMSVRADDLSARRPQRSSEVG